MDNSSQPTTRGIRDVDTSQQEWGSDFVADLLKAYDFSYVSFNPGASFRGLEESIVNYNDNDPRVIQTAHEGLSVSIAHGYAKATNEPALCVLHNVVGTLHGSMSLYNAYLDRVPLLVLSGTGPLRKSKRRPWIDWIHTGFVQGNLVREYVKWDDQPWHLDGVAESMARAYRIANTPPKGPTYVALDAEIQEESLDDPLEIPELERFSPPTRMAPEPDAIKTCIDCLVDAELPVIIVDQVGDAPETVSALVEFAELLGAPVVDIRWRRFNFPNTHPLDLSESTVFLDADTLLLLDVWSEDWLSRTVSDDVDTSGGLRDVVEDDPTIIDIGTDDIGISSFVANSSPTQADLSILADTTLAIPALRDVLDRRLDESGTDLSGRIRTRAAEMANRHDALREGWEEDTADRWDDVPVSTARLAAELWELIQDEPWVLVNGSLRGWARRLWDVDEFDQYIGGRSGGGGVGYGIGAAIGAALAYENTDRIPINLQADGDLMFYPGALWTVGHHEIPMLTVMHNNRSLYNSTAHRMRLAEKRGRDASYDRARIGTGYWDPTPNYASIAEAQGVTGYGPIENPDNVEPALSEAWSDVRSGQPALVDVVCQPR